MPTLRILSPETAELNDRLLESLMYLPDIINWYHCICFKLYRTIYWKTTGVNDFESDAKVLAKADVMPAGFEVVNSMDVNSDLFNQKKLSHLIESHILMALVILCLEIHESRSFYVNV